MKIQNNKIKNLINSLIKKSNKKLKTPKNSKKLYNEVDVVRNNFLIVLANGCFDS